eukprot:gene36152-21571_t
MAVQVAGLCEKLVAMTTFQENFDLGMKAHPVNEESYRLSPVSYGVQKAAVLGRPGWSNSISWSWTGIFTQTLAGKDFEVPGVLPMDRPYPCSCVRNNVDGLLHLASAVGAEQLGHNRVHGIRLGHVSQGALPKDATVKELNVCPRVDCAKAVALGLPNE